jgi:hypothetical protein
VHVEHEETTLKGYFEVFVGVEVTQLEEVPVELLVKILAGLDLRLCLRCTVSKFCLTGPGNLSTLAAWLRLSLRISLCFSIYDERFLGLIT